MQTTLLVLVLSSALSAQAPYDLLLKGGHVLDPKNNINGKMDVAIRGSKIARVAPVIDATQAKKVIPCDGLYVTPGLVDIHVHLYFSTALESDLHGDTSSYAGFRAVHPDGFTFRTGVTTVVDVGSSGWRNFPEFKDRVIALSKTRVYAMLNIVGSGMAGRAKVEQNLADMSAEETAKVARQFPEYIVGVKTAHYAGPEWTPVDTPLAGTLANIRVMVDFGSFRLNAHSRIWSQNTYAPAICTRIFSSALHHCSTRKARSARSCGRPVRAVSSSTWATGPVAFPGRMPCPSSRRVSGRTRFRPTYTRAA
jgi:dihydroorotase